MGSLETLQGGALLAILCVTAATLAALRGVAFHAKRRIAQLDAEALANAGMNEASTVVD